MKSKKMTFNMVATKMQEIAPVELTVYDDVTVEVKQRLDMKHALQFVQDVVSTCFDEEEATYIPEIFDAAVRIGTLMHYAGFEVPKDASKAFAVVYETDLFDRVLAVIDHKQFEELVTGAKRKMAFKRDLLTATAAQKVIELITKIDDVMSKSVRVMEQVNTEELAGTIREISDKLNAQISENDVAEDDDDNIIVMPRRKDEE